MKKVFYAWIVVVHGLLAVACAKSDFLLRIGRKIKIVPPAYTAQPGERLMCDKMNVFFNRQDWTVPEGSVIFIGDSLVHGLGLSAFKMPNHPSVPAINYGIGGERIEGTHQRLLQYESVEHAGAVCLLVGVNNLLNGDTDEQFKNAYISLIADAKRKADHVISLGLLPTSQIDSERLSRLNDWIKSQKDLEFLDCTALFRDSSGTIIKAYYLGDGLHLNKSGNDKLIKYLSKSLDAYYERRVK